MSWLCLLLIQRISLLSSLVVPDLAPDFLVDTCGICQYDLPANSIQDQPIVRKLYILGGNLVLVCVDILLVHTGIDIEVDVLQ